MKVTEFVMEDVFFSGNELIYPYLNHLRLVKKMAKTYDEFRKLGFKRALETKSFTTSLTFDKKHIKCITNNKELAEVMFKGYSSHPIVLDEHGNQVHINEINEANYKNPYYCIRCGSEMIVSAFNSDEVITHFKHKSDSKDILEKQKMCVSYSNTFNYFRMLETLIFPAVEDIENRKAKMRKAIEEYKSDYDYDVDDLSVITSVVRYRKLEKEINNLGFMLDVISVESYDRTEEYAKKTEQMMKLFGDYIRGFDSCRQLEAVKELHKRLGGLGLAVGDVDQLLRIYRSW